MMEQSKMTNDVPENALGLLREAAVKLRDCRGQLPSKRYAENTVERIEAFLAAHEPAPVDPLYAAAAHMRMEFMSSPTVWTDDDWYDVLREALELHASVRARYIAANEPAPVDPLREVVAKAWRATHFAESKVDVLTEELRARLPGIDDLARSVTLDSKGEG